MEYYFICKSCGHIEKSASNTNTSKLLCSNCNNPLSWDELFPPLSAVDFEHSVNALFENAKRCDKDNLSIAQELLTETPIDKTKLDKYINKYEQILCKLDYPFNDSSVWIKRDDEFFAELIKEMNHEEAENIFSAIVVNKRNEYRKPCYIMIATLIEQLFHDFFNRLLDIKLSQNGKIIFMEKYQHAGIQSVIEISSSFLDENLRNIMNKYSKGFYERWESLRKTRNQIIHNNNVYISKIQLSKAKKHLKESYTVFSNIISELYQP